MMMMMMMMMSTVVSLDGQYPTKLRATIYYHDQSDPTVSYLAHQPDASTIVLFPLCALQIIKPVYPVRTSRMQTTKSISITACAYLALCLRL